MTDAADWPPSPGCDVRSTLNKHSIFLLKLKRSQINPDSQGEVVSAHSRNPGIQAKEIFGAWYPHLQNLDVEIKVNVSDLNYMN